MIITFKNPDECYSYVYKKNEELKELKKREIRGSHLIALLAKYSFESGWKSCLEHYEGIFSKRLERNSYL